MSYLFAEILTANVISGWQCCVVWDSGARISSFSGSETHLVISSIKYVTSGKIVDDFSATFTVSQLSLFIAAKVCLLP